MTPDHPQKRDSKISEMQKIEDHLIKRFANVKRRLQYETPWFDHTTPYADLESKIRETILFYENRGFYLFQEPKLEHEPVNKRFRIHLTFRPTESNQ
ncbi:MAG: hypothetical protein AAF591_10945 [Verrucomicrobiota bacterium]